MPMIHPLDHFALQNILQFFQIEHHAGRRVRFSRNRHFERVVVPVSVRVAALAEDALVFFRRKLWVLVKVSSREFYLARNPYHRLSALKNSALLWLVAYRRPFHSTVPPTLFHHEAISAAE